MSECYNEKNCNCGVQAQPESLCGCGHKHAHADAEKGTARGLWEMGISALLLALAFLPMIEGWPKAILFALSALISGYPVVIQGYKTLRHGEMDETLLMSIASLAAFGMGEFAEGAAVTLFFRIGEAFEDYASRRSRNMIRSLSDLQPDTAHLLLADGKMQTVAAAEIAVASEIVILPHERVPLDGVILRGSSSLDAAALTGESLPVGAVPGERVSSGMMNADGTLVVRVSSTVTDSAAARIIRMVEDAVERKGSAHKKITRFARVYTPTVVVLAVLLFVIPSLITGDWQEWLRRALGFLVASCPCALVLSVPLSFFAGMGAAAKQGIIIKGGIFLENLAKARHFAFDKTGTLTTGEMSVSELTPAPGISPDTLLLLAAACETHSTHPLAKAIVTHATQSLPRTSIDPAQLSNFSEMPGGGTMAVYQGQQLLCGGLRLMQAQQIDVSALPESAVYLAADGKALGAIAFTGELRPQVHSLFQRLRSGKGAAKQLVMLTGDSESQAFPLAQELGMDTYRAGLLPEEKLRFVEQMKQEGSVVFVGDGINDAPVLAAADAGVAMGLGTQAASEAADIILVGSNLARLADAQIICRRTMRIVNSNIVFCLLVKGAILLLELCGLAPISAAVFADVGVLLVTVLNASRLLGRYAKPNTNIQRKRR